jgi:hypothetical protein
LTKREADTENTRDEVLKRMLKMKPKPHNERKAAPKKKVNKVRKTSTNKSA